MVALIVLALAIGVAAAMYIGSHQQRLPAPFGPAANGSNRRTRATSDIYVGDPVNGGTSSCVIVGGPTVDIGTGLFARWQR